MSRFEPCEVEVAHMLRPGFVLDLPLCRLSDDRVAFSRFVADDRFMPDDEMEGSDPTFWSVGSGVHFGCREALAFHFCRFTCVPAYAYGGYPFVFYDHRGDLFCAACASDLRDQARFSTLLAQGDDDRTQPVISISPYLNKAPSRYEIVFDVHWEGDSIYCCECGCEIESAYGPTSPAHKGE